MTNLIQQNIELHLKTVQDLIQHSLEDSKAFDIISIDLYGKSSIADAMIIASGRSERHVSAITDNLVKRLKTIGETPLSVEGKEQGDWVLVDMGDFIIHIFRPEVRGIYNLEKMWGIEIPEETFLLA